jgi:hypothetical protein
MALSKAKEAANIFQALAEAEPAGFIAAWSKALALEGTCYRSLPDRAQEIAEYGRAVILCCAKQHSPATIAGAMHDPLPAHVTP